MPILDGDRGETADHAGGLDIADHAALARDVCAGSDAKVIGDTALASNHDSVANNRAAGNADLSANHAVAAETNVVSDLNEIIEHAPSSNHGVAGSAAVDGAVRADLNIILDNHAAKLEHAGETFGAWNETKALRADRDAGFYLDAPPDDSVADVRIRTDPTLVSEADAIA